MCKAMLISVGGSPQPIVKSIKNYKPEFVSFLVSQQTSEITILIVNALKEEKISFEYEQTICDNPEDLKECYKSAEKAVFRIEKKGFASTDTVVDYTGGTKSMSVALALASINYGFSYSYVGGTERTKGGVGVVVDGKEQIFSSINPWDFLAMKERETIATLFNSYQFKSAKEVADSLTNKTTKYRSLFRKIGLIIEGFYQWDLFRHADALRMFERAKVDDMLLEYEEDWVQQFAEDVLASVLKLKEVINDISKPGIAMIYDLFSNAERRYEEGKIDDAILRLYRIVEMIAQTKLAGKYGIDVSNTSVEKIPESLREEFIKKYLDEDSKKLKIPQNAAFLLLKELGDEVGKVFVKNEKNFKAIQHSRNYSYLAHGFQSSSPQNYSSFRDFVLSLNVIDPSKVWQFPKLKTSR